MELIPDEEQLESIIQRIIDRQCERYKIKLTLVTRSLMTDSLVTFVFAATDKFIQGQKEHGGCITDRDLDFEIYKETIDQFWYGQAKGWKKMMGKS